MQQQDECTVSVRTSLNAAAPNTLISRFFLHSVCCWMNIGFPPFATVFEPNPSLK